MSNHTSATSHWNRRDFVKDVAALAGAASLSSYMKTAAAEPPPETTKLTLYETVITCFAPQYIAQELLHAEGFTDIHYVDWTLDRSKLVPDLLLSGRIDISLVFIPPALMHLDADERLVILAGSHTGCIELVGSDRVRSTADLKDKRVAVPKLASGEKLFISMFAAYVGINPNDIDWVILPYADQLRLFSEGKIDAFMTGPPYALELREKKIGHVLLNTTIDRPWSQYFCCAVASTKEFISKHPIATKRALRALVKAADVCATDPERVARVVADRGLGRYDYTLQSLREIPYGKWRNYNSEDAVRFFALRMREVGLIRSTPRQIIAHGTDWRFLNELKKELKA
jgi:NitT/TauT family transport system substrate-binding protein